MVLSPAMTWLFYVGGFALIVTCCAAVADLWTAKVERTARRRARAEARAKRMIGERSFTFDGR